MKTKKILLTGSTGFIGNAFLRLAISMGYEVGALILPGLKITEGLEKHPHIQWFSGSLNSAPWKEISKFSPEICLHTAWITTPGIYLNSPENFTYLNESVEFIRKAVECGVKQVVITGTCAEYKPSNKPLVEDISPIEPETIYGRCKYNLYRILNAESEKAGFNLAWARIFYPYGIGEHPDRLCSFIIRNLTNNQKVTLKTPDSVKDYIYITDIAEALLIIIEKNFSGAINIGTGSGITVREIARTIADFLNKKNLIEELNREQSPQYTVADITKLKKLGWKQQVSIEEGLKRLIDYYKIQ